MAVAATLAVAVGMPATALAQTAPGAPPIQSAASILVDVDTGRVLAGHAYHTPLPPASLTKTLTAMIAVGWLAPGSQVPVTADAFNAFPDKVGMKPGQKWPLDIALHALITDSANDAAYALAIDVAGSMAAFPAVMQEAAAEIGMSDHPVLEDPAGLDGSEGFHGGNRISAWDLAIAGRDMMAIPALAAIARQQTFDFEGPDHIAYHIVSRNLHFLWTYPGAIGVKTGFTDAAGYCDIEEAVKGTRHMLAVVLHSNDPDAVAAALLNQGFATPVAKEAADPELPPVRAPGPPPPPTATTTTAPAEGGGRVAAVATPVRGGAGRTGWIEVLAAAGVVAGVGVWTRKWVRRRGATRR
jgi:D-alanyl-D-alanine carboxypeptidase (penicillin-binding protein 5/6)